MSGAKTRFGFAGDGSEPPDSDEARAARTIIGRDIHLPVPPDSVAPGPSSRSGALPVVHSSGSQAATTETPGRRSVARASAQGHFAEEPTTELPSRQPARGDGSRLAKFLGRWTKSGRFVSEHGLSRNDGDIEIPRDPLARNLVLVLVVAVVTFVLTLLGVKLRQQLAGQPNRAAAAPTTQVPPRPQTAPPPVVAPNPSVATAPVPMPVPAVASPAMEKPQQGPQSARPGRPSANMPPRPNASKVRVRPDATLPDHLKTQLLPLGR